MSKAKALLYPTPPTKGGALIDCKSLLEIDFGPPGAKWYASPPVTASLGDKHPALATQA